MFTPYMYDSIRGLLLFRQTGVLAYNVCGYNYNVCVFIWVKLDLPFTQHAKYLELVTDTCPELLLIHRRTNLG